MIQIIIKKEFYILDINFQAPLVDLSTCINDFESWLEKYRDDCEGIQELSGTWPNVPEVEPCMDTGIEEASQPSLLALESSVRSVSPASALASHDYTDCSLNAKKTFEVSRTTRPVFFLFRTWIVIEMFRTRGFDRKYFMPSMAETEYKRHLCFDLAQCVVQKKR